MNEYQNRYNKWYKAEAHDVAHSVFATVSEIGNQNATRRADDERYMRMFGTYDISGMGEALPSYANAKSLRFNLVRSATLTAQAHIGSNKPFPAFVTTDADWSLTKKARGCELAVKGVFYYNSFYKTARKVFLDAAVSSLGALKVYYQNGRIKIERVFPGEILVDVREGFYGEPRNLYQAKLVDRDALAERFPKYRDDIEQSTSAQCEELFSWIDFSQKENLILVIEAWHLPSNDQKSGKPKGGKHVIAVQNAVLSSEEWKRETFPFAFYRWEERQFGFYGRGIVEQLRQHQRTINYIDMRIRDMMHALSRGKLVIWDNATSKVNTEHLTNSPIDILKIVGTGQPPTVMAQNAVPSEWWNYRMETIRNGFEEIGLNEMQSYGRKPPGIDSGVALREVDDAASKRFRPKVDDFDEFVLESARLIIRELKDAVDRGEKLTIQSKVKRGTKTLLELIDWSKVALKDEEYRLELTPRSKLPDTTYGRKQTVEDWYRAGFIDQKEARYLLDFPDLEGFNSLDLASHEIILESIETMIEDGEYVFPEPTDDLELLVKLATQSYNKFRLRKLPEDRLELLRRYVDDAQWLIKRAQQPTAEEMQGGQMTGMTPPAAAGAAMPVVAPA